MAVSSPGSGTPTGTVTFYDAGSTSLGSATLNSSDVATFAISSLTAGSHNITASYGGDSSFSGSTSAALAQGVNQAVPTVNVTDAGGVYDGNPFPATATVAGIDGVAHASLEGVSPVLTYYAGTSTSGTPVSAAPTGAGTYTVVATFPGSTDYTSASASTVFGIQEVLIGNPGEPVEPRRAGRPAMLPSPSWRDGLDVLTLVTSSSPRGNRHHHESRL